MANINPFSMGNYSIYSNYQKSSSLFGVSGLNRQSYSSNTLQRASSEFLNSYRNQAASPMSFLPNLKEKASSFNSSVKSLTSYGSSSVFNKKAAQSSDSELLTAKSSSASGLNAFRAADVKIDQVATAQKNEGKSMQSSGRSIARGDYSFAVDAGGKSRSFSIKVSAGDTDKAVQQKMADAVNKSNMGVKASVVQGENSKSSKLVFEASETGTKDGKDSFTVRDISGPSGKGLAAQTNTLDTTQKAQNAEYSVNGVKKTSRSNAVDLGNGVTATLKKASEETVRVSSGKDANAIKGAVSDFVDEYNSLVFSAKGNSLSKLSSALSGITNTYSRSLSSVGIEKDASGKLSIDSKKLDKAISSGKLEDTFRSTGSYGVGGRLQSTAGSIERNPMTYSKTSSLLSTYNTRSTFNNNYAAMYSGQLFNFLL